MAKSRGSAAVASKAAVAKKKTKAKPAAPSKKGGVGGGPSAATRIMEAIAGQMALGKDKADRAIVQGLAAMPNKGSFDTTLLNKKKKQNLVEYDKDTVWLTEKGIQQVGPDAIAKPQNNIGMQEKLKEVIGNKRSREIFDLLADGSAYTRQELAAKMGLEDNKSFGTYVSGLSKVVERVDAPNCLPLWSPLRPSCPCTVCNIVQRNFV